MKKYLPLLLVPLVSWGTQDVFDMPRLHPQHRQLVQEMVQSVRAGRIEDMEAVARKGISVFPQDATWHYNLACALSYRSDKTESLAMLERAIELGFRNAKMIEQDNDLKNLAKEPRFKALLEKAGQLQGKPITGVPQPQATTSVMGLPVKIEAGNTLWDFDKGCFHTPADPRTPLPQQNIQLRP